MVSMMKSMRFYSPMYSPTELCDSGLPRPRLLYFINVTIDKHRISIDLFTA